MPFVLDASVAVSWCFDDETSQVADEAARRIRVGDQPHVPNSWAYEVANAILASERRGRLAQQAAVRAIELVSALPVVADELSTARIWDAVFDTAQRTGLSTYDASYLELALREGLPLATLDRARERAARQAGV